MSGVRENPNHLPLTSYFPVKVYIKTKALSEPLEMIKETVYAIHVSEIILDY